MKRTIYSILSAVALGCSGAAVDDEPVAKLTDEIIGGYVTQPGEAPWQAGIWYAGSFQCGASLIAPDWVLTAAHCETIVSDTTIILGDWDQETSESTEQARAVDRIVKHPDFYYDYSEGRPGVPTNDLALVHVTSPFKIKPGVVELVRPSTQRAEEVSESLATGWGRGGGFILNGAALPIQPTSACASSTLDRPQLLPGEICAGRITGGFLGMCYGDSGGALVGRSDAASPWQQVGVASWGKPPNCDSYSVFQRVQYFLPFIRKYVVDVAALTAVGAALQ